MKKYVLVIGATPEYSQEIRRHLEDETTEIIFSITTDDARYQFSLHKIILVIMELSYVRPESRELFQTLRQQNPTPILILYANAKEVFLHKKGIVNDAATRKRETVLQMSDRLKAMKAGRTVIDGALSELTPLLTVESLDRDIVNLLIDKIIVRGENDIEIIWNGRYGA